MIERIDHERNRGLLPGGFYRKIGNRVEPSDASLLNDTAEPRPKFYIAERMGADARYESSAQAYFDLDVQVYRDVMLTAALSLGTKIKCPMDIINKVFWPTNVVAAVPTHLYLEGNVSKVLDTTRALTEAKISMSSLSLRSIDLVPSVACAAAAYREIYMKPGEDVSLIVIDVGLTKIDVAFVFVHRDVGINVFRAQCDGAVGMVSHNKTQVMGRCRQLVEALMKSVPSTIVVTPVRALIVGGYQNCVRKGLLETLARYPPVDIEAHDAPLLVAKGAAILCRDVRLDRLPRNVSWHSLKTFASLTAKASPGISSGSSVVAVQHMYSDMMRVQQLAMSQGPVPAPLHLLANVAGDICLARINEEVNAEFHAFHAEVDEFLVSNDRLVHELLIPTLAKALGEGHELLHKLRELVDAARAYRQPSGSISYVLSNKGTASYCEVVNRFLGEDAWKV